MNLSPIKMLKKTFIQCKKVNFIVPTREICAQISLELSARPLVFAEQNLLITGLDDLPTVLNNIPLDGSRTQIVRSF